MVVDYPPCQYCCSGPFILLAGLYSRREHGLTVEFCVVVTMAGVAQEDSPKSSWQTGQEPTRTSECGCWLKCAHWTKANNAECPPKKSHESMR